MAQSDIYNFIRNNRDKMTFPMMFYHLKAEHSAEDIRLIIDIEFEDEFKEESNDSIQRYDSEFKDEVKKYYSNTCVITGENFYETIEVAHIKPFSVSDDYEKYDPNNGLILRADIHRLFDKFSISIHPTTFEIVCNRTRDSYIHTKKYEGKIISVNPNSSIYLEHHFNEFTDIL